MTTRRFDPWAELQTAKGLDPKAHRVVRGYTQLGIGAAGRRDPADTYCMFEANGDSHIDRAVGDIHGSGAGGRLSQPGPFFEDPSTRLF